jgi:DNA-binding CsgD family transcriptional regulator
MIGGVSRRASSQSFVGRVAELEELGEALERATHGQPSLVLIAGEAGVGKSRLLTEFSARAEASGAMTATGGCLDVGEGGLPYAPFVEALRALARRLDPADIPAVFGPSAGVLGSMIPDLRRVGLEAEETEPAGPADRLARLFDAVIGTLGRLSTERPLVLILEDLHWADGSSRDLLRFLVRNIRDERLLILATYRSDDLHRRHPLMPLLGELERGTHVGRLELRRFDREELGEQLTGILGEAPSPALVDSLLARSDGLPFYVEELVASDARSGPGLPSNLRDILGLRLATLSPASLALVRAASVIGGRVSHARLAATFGGGEEALIAALRDAIDTQVLIPTDIRDEPGYTFRHALLREAAYEELLPAERVRLHARLADHLEAAMGSIGAPDPSMIADLALHAYHAHDQPRALVGSVLALRAFVAAMAYREALSHAERALELWPRVEEAATRVDMDHPGLLTLASRSASATNQAERAALLAKEALAELTSPEDRDRRAELLADLWLITWEAEDFETSSAAIEEAYGLVEHAEPNRSKARVVLSLGFERWGQHHLRESLRLCEEAMAMSQTLGDDAAWATAASGAAHTLADLGWGARAAEMADRSADRVTEFDGRYEWLSADIDRSIALWTVGRFADSASIAAAGLERAQRYGWEARLGSGFRGCLADAFFELGRYDAVEVVTRPGIAGEGIVHTIVWAALTMTRAAVARGQLDEAHRLVDDLMPHITMVGGFHQLSEIELARAEGRFDAVVSAIAEVIDRRAGGERVIPLPMVFGAGIGAAADRAVLARQRRRAAEAAEAADHAGRWLGSFRSLVEGTSAEGGAGPFLEALLATAEADMTRLQGVSDPSAWADAIDRWSALEHPHQGATARLRLAEALLESNGERAEVEALLGAAYETAASLGAAPLREAIEAVAARARIDLDKSVTLGVGEPDAPTVLTARERDVVRLVAEGHTNREIGDRLFISEKTVSVHVSNAMAKLGALSRYEAAAAAERQGLL